MAERLTKASECFDGFIVTELEESSSEMGCGEYCEMVCGEECGKCQIQKAFNKLAAYEYAGLEPEDIKAAFNEAAVLKLAAQILSTTPDRLEAICNAERDGRCVVLPVPLTGTAYGIMPHDDEDDTIESIELDNGFDRIENWPSGEIVITVDGWEIGISDIGKTVFLSREAAEAALAGKDGQG